MLKINAIARPDRFLNEGASFVPSVNNSTGTMNFTLTSPELLDLASYQRTLKDLIYVLASHDPNNNTRCQSSSLEINLGSGGTLLLDTSVIEHDSKNGTSTYTMQDDSRPSSAHAYPLSFQCSGLLPTLCPSIGANQVHSKGMAVPSGQLTTPPVLYYIRLPWNPHTDAIQCQLSARRLCTKHVSLLDKILRYLCDASPGALMVGYSDGPSGVEAGTQVVYSGEDSPLLQKQHCVSHFEHKNGGLDQDRGNVEMDHCVPELSGHIEHPGMTHGKPKHGHLEDPMSKKRQKVSKPTIVSTIPSLDNEENVQSQDRGRIEVGLAGCMHGRENGVLDYEFGLSGDIDPLTTLHDMLSANGLHDMLDADDFHDMLWVK
ncbi:hypothetical protein BG011_000675 [Mortierella polycephala]|uniref:Uncharacterized protein n=1 Tax=Mortierella polycephala TaxID=41804 RepID=A0A9P6U6H7_9FUNG|nr:hypothetical protein BG011_000675 [Mortierella polycephala]